MFHRNFRNTCGPPADADATSNGLVIADRHAKDIHRAVALGTAPS